MKNGAVADAGPVPHAASQWVVFACDGRRFGLPLERVVEIMTPRPFTRLPGAGGDVCGLIGVRGRITTVFDLGVVLGVRAAAVLPDHRLLLLELGDRRVGGAVDEVLAIATASLERDTGVDAPFHDAVLGAGQREEGAFVALDPRVLLQSRLQG